MTTNVGQLLLVGLGGHSLSNREIKLIQETKPGGFILFARNCSTPEQIFALNKHLYTLYNQLNLAPPFISIDQEGGKVQRLPQQYYPYFPSFRTLGKKDNLKLTYDVTLALAENLRHLGFNLNFSPVLDLDTNPQNPVINSRSLGSDPIFVAKHASQVIRAYHQSGILACGKHFPGHGDTSTDSHLDLPRLDANWRTLIRRELIPYIKTIPAGLQAIMTAHIVFTEIDSLPVTISQKALGKLLKTVDFNGLVFSDDLEMRAIAANYPLDSVINLGLNAGIDVFIISKDSDLWQQAHQILTTLNQGPEVATIIEKKINKITEVRAQGSNLTTYDNNIIDRGIQKSKSLVSTLVE